MTQFDRITQRIMRKLLGWDAKEMREDQKDYPEQHERDRKWLQRELHKVPEALVVDEMEARRVM